MTFSIAARCPRTGRFGVAVSSSSPAVAARCAYVRPGVGAACSQNVTDPRLGPRLLELLADGVTDPVARLVREEPLIEWRQLTAVGASGKPVWWSGRHTLGTNEAATGADAVAAGNLLDGPGVPQAMIDAFAAEPGLSLAARLLAALAAGLTAGGEAGPVHSAGLLVAGSVSWPVTDLRVDWTEGDPVAELAALHELWAPQEEDYLRRAVAPHEAPSYGVAGDA